MLKQGVLAPLAVQPPSLLLQHFSTLSTIHSAFTLRNIHLGLELSVILWYYLHLVSRDITRSTELHLLLTLGVVGLILIIPLSCSDSAAHAHIIGCQHGQVPKFENVSKLPSNNEQQVDSICADSF